jgi:hypothetical protein
MPLNTPFLLHPSSIALKKSLIAEDISPRFVFALPL